MTTKSFLEKDSTGKRNIVKKAGYILPCQILNCSKMLENIKMPRILKINIFTRIVQKILGFIQRH